MMYRKCCICGGSYVGTGTACPECEKAVEKYPPEINWLKKTDARVECVRNPETKCVDCELCACADKETK